MSASYVILKEINRLQTEGKNPIYLYVSMPFYRELKRDAELIVGNPIEDLVTFNGLKIIKCYETELQADWRIADEFVPSLKIDYCKPIDKINMFIEQLNVKDGDIVAIRPKDMRTFRQMMESTIISDIKSNIPKDITFIIFPPDIDISVIRKL